MLLTTLVLGAPLLITNFFSGQVAAAFQSYNAVSGAARPDGGPSNQQEMMAGKGLGGNTQKQPTDAQDHFTPLQETTVYRSNTNNQNLIAGSRGLANNGKETD